MNSSSHTTHCVNRSEPQQRVEHKRRTPDQACTVAVQVLTAARGDRVSQAQWGEACGASQQRASMWEDAACPMTPGLVHLIRACSTPQRVVVKRICEAMIALCDDAPMSMRSIPEQVCMVSAEHGDVARECAVALLDGHMTATEAMRVLREIHEERAALDQLERMVLDAAAKEGR